MSVLPLLLVWTWTFSAFGDYINININIGTSAINNIDNRFVGTTIDSSLMPTPRAWGGLDFSSEKVRVLARGLSPLYLRVGGYLGDKMTFDPTGHGDPNLTFTASTWDALNEFVESVGWDLIFGLNDLQRTKDGEWDPTNAMELLQYTSQKKYKLPGVELGNEPRAFNASFNITGTQLGKDFFKLKSILQTLPDYNSTLLVGPDIAAVTYEAAADFFTGFLTGGASKAVDRITLHHYFCVDGTATLSMFFDVNSMDFVRTEIEAAQNLSRKTNPTTPIWIGETGSCVPWGARGLSDTYVSGFRWLDELGLAARSGAEAVIRQDFYNGAYALLEQSTFDPLPDYWLTLLYKSLVGSPVLTAESNSSYFRTYAHCTRKDNPYGYIPGSVVIYIVVVNDDVVKLSIPQFKEQPVHVFWLEPIGNVTSQFVSLNGLPLELTNNNELPEFSPEAVTEEKLYLPGKTFGFLVIPNANLAVCKP